jgi:hypothetical protein
MRWYVAFNHKMKTSLSILDYKICRRGIRLRRWKRFWERSERVSDGEIHPRCQNCQFVHPSHLLKFPILGYHLESPNFVNSRLGPNGLWAGPPSDYLIVFLILQLKSKYQRYPNPKLNGIPNLIGIRNVNGIHHLKSEWYSSSEIWMVFDVWNLNGIHHLKSEWY